MSKDSEHAVLPAPLITAGVCEFVTGGSAKESTDEKGALRVGPFSAEVYRFRVTATLSGAV